MTTVNQGRCYTPGLKSGALHRHFGSDTPTPTPEPAANPEDMGNRGNSWRPNSWEAPRTLLAAIIAIVVIALLGAVFTGQKYVRKVSSTAPSIPAHDVVSAAYGDEWDTMLLPSKATPVGNTPAGATAYRPRVNVAVATLTRTPHARGFTTITVTPGSPTNHPTIPHANATLNECVAALEDSILQQRGNMGYHLATCTLSNSGGDTIRIAPYWNPHLPEYMVTTSRKS